MNSLSLRLPSRRVGYIAAAFMLLFATLLSTFASAAQITVRSIQLSSATVSAPNVTYSVNFTPDGDAGATVIDFCDNTPLYGEDCDTPTGFDLTGATVPTASFTDENVVDANTIRVTGAFTAPTPVAFEITGVDNPSVSGPIYARIMTFDTASNANAYVSNPVEPAVNAGLVDSGSVALSIVNNVSVSGAVLESMTFCVAKNTISANCDLTGNEAPTLQLGQDIGNGVFALGTTVSTGTINTQISTNADGGAVVSLKSSATNCGGLKLVGSSDVNNCYISPAGTSGDIAAGEAKFGVKLASAFATSGVTDATGTLQPASATYNATNYRMNGVTNNSTGVTSTYGDPFLNTAGDPVNNQNMLLTFGAQVSNNTPAGLYSTDLSLIATGTF